MSLSQLSKLLPLPESDIQQVLDYASTLSKQDAVEHFNNLLGESPQSIEFIASFNSRRQDPTASTASQSTPQPAESGVPKSVRKPVKKKALLHTPAPRQIQDAYAAQGTAYVKKNEDDYMPKRPSADPAPNSTDLSSTHPKPASSSTPKPPLSAAGTLISDLKPPKSKSKPTSRSTSPSPFKPSKSTTTTKIHIPGGPAMHSASSTLSTLDSALRTLELSTNSSLLPSTSQRKCTCNATRHALLTSAPNCLHCGKIICVKEGLGPCTFCGMPLLRSDEVQSMIRALREERGKEKMAVDNKANRRAEISKKPAAFSSNITAFPSISVLDTTNLSPAEQAAKEHRDKLLSFQAQNAQRTTVRDEAADFDVPVHSRGNMWASPVERARELKRQQKVLAEMEWNARPEWERKREVVSLDVVGGKVVKRMARVEVVRPEDEVGSSGLEEDEDLGMDDRVLREGSGNSAGGGTFSRNPLLGQLIKPIYHVDTSAEGSEQGVERRRKTWRRVQDDLDDNEDVILDGGVYGAGGTGRADGGVEADEPGCG